jgi:NAD(P)H-hydrate epimerase
METPVSVPHQWISPAVAQRIDQIATTQFLIPSLLLMEQASLHCAVHLRDEFRDLELVVFCGTGNNGGDGLAIARHWVVWGGIARVVLVGDPSKLKADSLVQWQIVRALKIPVAIWPPATATFESKELPEVTLLESTQNLEVWLGDRGRCVCVDALLGTGSVGALRPPLPDLVNWINDRTWPVVAIDIPTGLDPESGQVAEPAVRAAITITMVAQKTGFTTQAAQACLGRVTVVGIGAPPAAIQQALDESK